VIRCLEVQGDVSRMVLDVGFYLPVDPLPTGMGQDGCYTRQLQRPERNLYSSALRQPRWMSMRLPAVRVRDKSDHAWQALRDQEARLWAHALLQDELFVQRSNFFLVAESLLVVSYTGILGLSFSVHEQPLRLRVAALVLAIFGCSLTVMWAFVNGRQRQVLLDLHKRAREAFPEYRRTIEERKLPGGRISGTLLMAFGVPVLAAIMWLIFVIIAF
jgi:hypothetical protein